MHPIQKSSPRLYTLEICRAVSGLSLNWHPTTVNQDHQEPDEHSEDKNPFNVHSEPKQWIPAGLRLIKTKPPCKKTWWIKYQDEIEPDQPVTTLNQTLPFPIPIKQDRRRN
jgi:hypothetical protein